MKYIYKITYLYFIMILFLNYENQKSKNIKYKLFININCMNFYLIQY